MGQQPPEAKPVNLFVGRPVACRRPPPEASGEEGQASCSENVTQPSDTLPASPVDQTKFPHWSWAVCERDDGATYHTIVRSHICRACVGERETVSIQGQTASRARSSPSPSPPSSPCRPLASSSLPPLSSKQPRLTPLTSPPIHTPITLHPFLGIPPPLPSIFLLSKPAASLASSARVFGSCTRHDEWPCPWGSLTLQTVPKAAAAAASDIPQHICPSFTQSSFLYLALPLGAAGGTLRYSAHGVLGYVKMAFPCLLPVARRATVAALTPHASSNPPHTPGSSPPCALPPPPPGSLAAAAETGAQGNALQVTKRVQYEAPGRSEFLLSVHTSLREKAGGEYGRERVLGEDREGEGERL
ncbi:hypothetical protein O3P69_017948 [Scylla paramamosain]|uniref:Uncharacterized protein n=1 Tax=Scylla paramamosain TaxID=85552 RepID=A0AAW0TH49_SCYPA